MIEMGVCEHDRGDGTRLDGQAPPVLQAQRFEALKQAAIYEQAMTVALKKVFGAGHGAGGAEERKLETHGETLAACIDFATRGAKSLMQVMDMNVHVAGRFDTWS